MKKGKIMSMIVPIIFVIIPQIIVIIASSFMKNDQSIILNIGGSIGIICGLLALILIYQNKINVTVTSGITTTKDPIRRLATSCLCRFTKPSLYAMLHKFCLRFLDGYTRFSLSR